MKIFLLITLLVVLFIGLFVYFIVGFPFGCKKENQTFIIGKEKCCLGLDWAPITDRTTGECLPKLPNGMEY